VTIAIEKSPFIGSIRLKFDLNRIIIGNVIMISCLARTVKRKEELTT